MVSGENFTFGMKVVLDELVFYHRHHNGLASETGRHSAGRHSNDKREGFGRREKSEAEEIP